MKNWISSARFNVTANSSPDKSAKTNVRRLSVTPAPVQVSTPSPAAEPVAAEFTDEGMGEDDEDGVEVTMDDLLTDEEAESLDDTRAAAPAPEQHKEAFIAPEPMKVE